MLQALEVIQEVGDMIALKYSRQPVPAIDESEIELLEVTKQREFITADLKTDIPRVE